MVPRDGVRAGVPTAEDIEGGGVGLFRRPPVSVRKAVKSAWVEERRSGVRGTSSDGGDIRLGVAGAVCAWRGCAGFGATTGRAGTKGYRSGARASSLSWVLDGDRAGIWVPIWLWLRAQRKREGLLGSGDKVSSGEETWSVACSAGECLVI